MLTAIEKNLHISTLDKNKNKIVGLECNAVNWLDDRNV